MGFLRHDTNNIIVDAVLTSKGREFLAQNDGSFSIVKFSLADDEVDYSIIKKYGRTVGKEKIEKNTPVYEALTNGSQSVKYRCLSLSPASMGGALYYPVGSFEGDTQVTTNNVLKLSTRNGTNRSFKFVLKMVGDETVIPEDFQSGTFEIQINSNLLVLAGEIAEFTYPDMTAAYEIAASKSSSSEVTVNPTISLKPGLTSTANFNLYKVSSESYIRTYIRITHRNSGITKNLEVQIFNTTI